MVSAIASVTGPVEAADLAHVLVHEHVVCGAAGVTRGAAALAGGLDALIERAVMALQAARAAGLRSIVDATPFDLGRDDAAIRRIMVDNPARWLVGGDPPMSDVASA